MKTPLANISLKQLCLSPVLFDANIFMVGINDRTSDANYSFQNMKELYLIPLFAQFERILIHEAVLQELDTECRKFIDSCSNVQIVVEGDLYGKDPLYTTLFNTIAENENVQYRRTSTKDKGEVYSLAYAAFHNISYFSSKEVMVDIIADEIPELKSISIITFDVIILVAVLYHLSHNTYPQNKKALKAVYKRNCEDVIRRHKLPATLSEYLEASQCYLSPERSDST